LRRITCCVVLILLVQQAYPYDCSEGWTNSSRIVQSLNNRATEYIILMHSSDGVTPYNGIVPRPPNERREIANMIRTFLRPVYEVHSALTPPSGCECFYSLAVEMDQNQLLQADKYELGDYAEVERLNKEWWTTLEEWGDCVDTDSLR
jgi:hypothetical protein